MHQGIGEFFLLGESRDFFSDGMVETLLKYIVIAHFFLLILYFAFFLKHIDKIHGLLWPSFRS